MSGNNPSQYPKPVASGGTRSQGTGYRTLRGPIATDVRQPDLGNPPRVKSVTGFGTGAGAYIRNQGSGADQSQGLVMIRCGVNPGASGTIVLTFPIAPQANQYWLAGEWCGNPLATPAGNDLSIAWVNSRPLLPNELLTLAYQWSVST